MHQFPRLCLIIFLATLGLVMGDGVFPEQAELDLKPGIVKLPYETMTASPNPHVRFTSPLTAGQPNIIWSARRLPPGLTLNRQGVLSGKPKKEGEFSFIVSVRSNRNILATATRTILITRSENPQIVDPPPAATEADPRPLLPNAVWDSPYVPDKFNNGYKLQAEGGLPFGPRSTYANGYRWALVKSKKPAERLPPGMTLNARGVISGTPKWRRPPAPTEPLTYKFKVRAFDFVGNSAIVECLLIVEPPGSPEILTECPLPEGLEKAPYAVVELRATNGRPPYTWPKPEGLPEGLEWSERGYIRGSPAAAGEYPITLKVVDKNGFTASLECSIKIRPAPEMKCPDIPCARVGDTLAPVKIPTLGGDPPYTWSATGLPLNLVLDPQTGFLSGVFQTPGKTPFTISVVDSKGRSASIVCDVDVAERLEITTPRLLPFGIRGSPYPGKTGDPVVKVEAAGGWPVYKWSRAIGQLPPGLSIDPDSGEIRGTPTSIGTYKFTLRATDSCTTPGKFVDREFEIRVYDPLVITTVVFLDCATVDKPLGTFCLKAAGGLPAYRWDIESGALPQGLGLDPVTGCITGTPRQEGKFPVVFRVTDENGTTDSRLVDVETFGVLRIDTPCPLPFAVAGRAYGPFQLTQTGGRPGYVWSATGLPKGLTCSASGVISGAPSETGTFPVALQVTDACGNVDARVCEITVYNPLAIDTVTIFGCHANGQDASECLAASGGSGDYRWSILEGRLPANLSLDPATGCISGRLAEQGNFEVLLELRDLATDFSVTKRFNFRIESPLEITTPCPLPDLTNGVAMTPVTLQGSGGKPPYSWVITPAIPGLSLNGNSLSGTPNLPGPYPLVRNFTIEMTDSCNNKTTKVCSVRVVSPVEITQKTISVCLIVGDPASLLPCLTATGGSGAHTWTHTGGTLPPGSTLNSSSGCFEGTLSTAGTHTFTIMATDAFGQTGSENYTVTVNPSLNITVANPLPDGLNGDRYADILLTAIGGSGSYTSWSLVTGDGCGAAPAGLFVEGNVFSGFRLAGTPNVAGPFPRTFSFCLRVTDSCGKFHTETFTLTILNPLRCDQRPDPGCSMEGDPITPICFSPRGGTGIYSYSATDLPPGVQISSNGCIEGTPTGFGNFNYTVTVNDGVNSVEVSGSLSVSQKLAFTTPVLGAWTLGGRECKEIRAVGGRPPYRMNYTVSPIDPGLDVREKALGVWEVCWTPDMAGTFTLGFEITDSCNKRVSTGYSYRVTDDGGEDLLIEMVPVCDASNAMDTTGYGRVDYCYDISKYEITNAEYVFFLNRVAQTDPYELYDARMATHVQGGINRHGSPEGFVYLTKSNHATLPVVFVNWFDAARFVNWLGNGQPSGGAGPGTTENGTYNLDGQVSGIFWKQAINPNTAQAPRYWIPSEDEWYKAAYYKGGGLNAGYWEYPTRSDSLPGNVAGGGFNQANFISGNTYSKTQSASFSAFQNYLFQVGSYFGSPSPYGTFDQGGNVAEWNDAVQNNFERGIRGGSWISTLNLHKGARSLGVPNALGDEFTGFRIAGTHTVPQPAPTPTPTPDADP